MNKITPYANSAVSKMSSLVSHKPLTWYFAGGFFALALKSIPAQVVYNNLFLKYDFERKYLLEKEFEEANLPN
jgi:hypothetical protein